ncbi:MAG: hypothetical protein GKS01_07365 [Alphaproteobacteria bacterium]|nr:hypothetical protein [Alphaproteobacteria bacterium]
MRVKEKKKRFIDKKTCDLLFVVIGLLFGFVMYLVNDLRVEAIFVFPLLAWLLLISIRYIIVVLFDWFFD